MSPAGDTAWEAIVIHPADDVAVALGPVAGSVRVRRESEVLHLLLLAPIEVGHKIALRDIAAGAPVRKYGEIIGNATVDIPAGGHVHVHNLRSRRAQGGGHTSATAPAATRAAR